MLLRISERINAFSTRMGEWTSLLILPLLGVVIYEVLMRYGFNSPTVWGFEATTFIYGVHYMFGVPYTDVTGGHVRVDIFTSRAKSRTKALISALTTLVFFLPVMSCLTWGAFRFAGASLADRELNPTSWAPPIYPIKIIMALTLLFLFCQGVSNLMRDLSLLLGQHANGDEED